MSEDVTARPRGLTDEQQAIVVENFNLARKFAGEKQGRRLSFDELLSACSLALCYAARGHRKDGGAAFSNYAWTAMQRWSGREAHSNRTIRITRHGLSRNASPECAAAAERAWGLAFTVDPADAPNLFVVPLEEEEGDTEALHRAIARLNGRYREVVRLHWLEGLTYAEIGLRWGCSSQNVEATGKRALADLRELLEGEGPPRPSRKKCAGPCGQVRPRADFGRCRGNLDGLRHACRRCISLRERRRYQEDRDRERDGEQEGIGDARR